MDSTAPNAVQMYSMNSIFISLLNRRRGKQLIIRVIYQRHRKYIVAICRIDKKMIERTSSSGLQIADWTQKSDREHKYNDSRIFF